MSWHAFSDFMWGVSKACFSAYDQLQKHEQQQSLQPASRGGFQQFIQEAARRLRAKVRWHENSVELTVPMEGDEHTVAVIHHSGHVVASVPSGTTFPAGDVPRDVITCLRSRNNKLDFASWDLIEADPSFFALKTDGRLDHIDPAAFAYVIQRMVIESVALDRTLAEVGYA